LKGIFLTIQFLFLRSDRESYRGIILRRGSGTPFKGQFSNGLLAKEIGLSLDVPSGNR